MAIAFAIDNFRRGRAATSSPLGARWPLGRETVVAALRLVLGSLLLCDPMANQAWKGRRLLLQSAIQVWEGWWLFLPRRLAVSRVRDAMDANGQMRHSAWHTAPLFQRDAPPLASSQRPPLVASQRNAPLQQPLVPSQREGVAPLQQPLVSLQQLLVTSQREGVAPLQQPLVPPQRLRPVSHQDVPPLVSSRRDAPSMNQARGRSCSRSRPTAPIFRDPRSWSSLFKALVGSPDLRLDFLAPEVQAD
ncbi:hypothetical protein GW17_00049511 [Ensete ventricosum]|nr:hypothetical protein GW17_00049511 [Ensete ventricosum]